MSNHALEIHAAGNRNFDDASFECRFVQRAEFRGQGAHRMRAAEVVRERLSRFAQPGKFRAALGDDLVLVGLVRLLFLVAHCQPPCFGLAVMKSSRSPSSTPWVLPISIPVRRSLMRDWSRTYERIWWPQPMSVLESSSLSCSAWRLRNSSS